MKRLVVLDTNVIVSALKSPNGTPAMILNRFFDGEIQICCGKDIFSEYEDVLLRPELKIDPEKAISFLEIVKELSFLTNPPASKIDLPDEDDRIFYDTAKNNGAILITGNIKHFPDEDFIMAPRHFFESEW